MCTCMYMYPHIMLKYLICLSKTGFDLHYVHAKVNRRTCTFIMFTFNVFQVFFLKSREKYGEMPMRKFIQNRKLKILFENDAIRVLFEKLTEHRCKKCPDRIPERNFKALRDHVRRAHTLFYCDLCLVLKVNQCCHVGIWKLSSFLKDTQCRE